MRIVVFSTFQDMITVYLKDKDRKLTNVDSATLKGLEKRDILWIDLDNPKQEQRSAVEQFINQEIPSREKAEEIESTSKYYETPEAIVANCNYFLSEDNSYQIEPTTFIITKEGLLVADHTIHPASFNEVSKRIELMPEKNQNGYEVFMTILESLIDYDADTMELINREIAELAKDINSRDNIDKKVLHRINSLQEKTMSMRENVFDLQRVVSAIMKSTRFPENIQSRLHLMIKDVDSLISHGEISFERLDYMQDTALGLINIEQNEIVKIFSVAAVIFMPPTLIASIYGMNFKLIPELNWTWTLNNGWVIPTGYIFAISLMVFVTLITYLFFKYKKWL